MVFEPLNIAVILLHLLFLWILRWLWFLVFFANILFFIQALFLSGRLFELSGLACILILEYISQRWLFLNLVVLLSCLIGRSLVIIVGLWMFLVRVIVVIVRCDDSPGGTSTELAVSFWCWLRWSYRIVARTWSFCSLTYSICFVTCIWLRGVRWL